MGSVEFKLTVLRFDLCGEDEVHVDKIIATGDSDPLHFLHGFKGEIVIGGEGDIEEQLADIAHAVLLGDECHHDGATEHNLGVLFRHVGFLRFHVVLVGEMMRHDVSAKLEVLTGLLARVGASVHQLHKGIAEVEGESERDELPAWLHVRHCTLTSAECEREL